MKKLDLVQMESIQGGDKCSRLQRRFNRCGDARSAKSFGKAVRNPCQWALDML